MNIAATTTILRYLENTDRALSRTLREKSVATAASSKKRNALLSGEELVKQIDQNREVVARYIGWKRNYVPQNPEELVSTIVALAEIAGMNVLPEGIFRSWKYDGTENIRFSENQLIDPRAIFSTLYELASDLLMQLKNANDSARGLQIVASAEWDIVVGPLHPFYDACGRVSRYFSTLLCLSFSLPLVWRGDRDAYFSHAVQGKQAFIGYFLSCDRVTLPTL